MKLKLNSTVRWGKYQASPSLQMHEQTTDIQRFTIGKEINIEVRDQVNVKVSFKLSRSVHLMVN